MALRVDDVAPNGYAIDRATVRQRKTGQNLGRPRLKLDLQYPDQFDGQDVSPGLSAAAKRLEQRDGVP
jgi:hypothetical protein